MIVLWNSADMVVRATFVDGSKKREVQWEAGRALARDMLSYLRDELAKDEKTFDDIMAIGVFRGPGSYTGLRIGLTVLNTFASARNISIVGSTADNWQDDCLARLEAGDNDGVVLPEYGGDAHVTKPVK